MEPVANVETFKDLFANYMEYNKALRTWFVTFGLGGVSLFLINDKLGAALKASGNTRVVVLSFLAGCAFQVGITMINKHCGWYAYNSTRLPDMTRKRTYRFWLWLEKSYWLDVISDFATVALFAWAVIVLLRTFV